MQSKPTTFLFRCSLAVAVAGAAGCKSGIFDNDDVRWRVPDEQLKRIDALDPTAKSAQPPVPR